MKGPCKRSLILTGELAQVLRGLVGVTSTKTARAAELGLTGVPSLDMERLLLPVFSLGGFYAIDEGNQQLSMIPVALLAWSAGHFVLSYASRLSRAYRALTPLKQSMWNDRIISTVHAVLMAVQGWRTVLHHPIGHPTGAPASPHSPMTREWATTVQWSFGYYIFDIGRMCFDFLVRGGRDPEFAVMCAHHLVMLSAHPVVLLSRTVIGLSAFGYLAEMSTPALNMRWLMMMSGSKGSPAFMAVTKLLACLFFVFRVLLFPTAFLLCLRGGQPPAEKRYHLLLWLGNTVGSVVWMRGLLKSIAKGSRQAASKSQ